MILRLFLAAVHLLALGLGLGAIWGRARALGTRPLDVGAVRRAFVADTWWGVAAVLWLSTGLWRLFAGTEKPTSYYMRNSAFRAKMFLFVLILALEVWPMVTLIRWRRAGAALQPDENTAGRMSAISYVELVLVVAIVGAAVTMARWVGQT